MNTKKISIVIIGAMMLFSTAGYGDEQKLTIYLDGDFAPYSYEKDGTIQGIAVDIMAEILTRTGSSQNLDDFKIVPWAQGYKALESEKNTVLFPMTQTDERLRQFKWVCSIAERNTELVGLKKNAIKISSTDEMKNYKFSAVADDVGEQLIKASGVPNEMIIEAADYDAQFRDVFTGNAQLVASNLEDAQSFAKISGRNPADLESVLLVNTSQLCYAFNKGVDDAAIATLQKAMDVMVIDGTHAKFTAKYYQ
jgi:polar amino acid transport system substrate-binding protein